MSTRIESRCRKCVHRKVCAYREYFTEKEAEGIDKCKNFKTDPKVIKSRNKNFS